MIHCYFKCISDSFPSQIFLFSLCYYPTLLVDALVYAHFKHAIGFDQVFKTYLKDIILILLQKEKSFFASNSNLTYVPIDKNTKKRCIWILYKCGN